MAGCMYLGLAWVSSLPLDAVWGWVMFALILCNNCVICGWFKWPKRGSLWKDGMLWELAWFSNVHIQLLCSCLEVWEAWEEVVITELNWNRTERLNSIWNRSSQENILPVQNCEKPRRAGEHRRGAGDAWKRTISLPDGPLFAASSISLACPVQWRLDGSPLA